MVRRARFVGRFEQDVANSSGVKMGVGTTLLVGLVSGLLAFEAWAWLPALTGLVVRLSHTAVGSAVPPPRVARCLEGAENLVRDRRLTAALLAMVSLGSALWIRASSARVRASSAPVRASSAPVLRGLSAWVAAGTAIGGAMALAWVGAAAIGPEQLTWHLATQMTGSLPGLGGISGLLAGIICRALIHPLSPPATFSNQR